MTRITLADSTEESIKKICDGNPGALSVVMRIFKQNDFLGNLLLVALDQKGIYEGQIWYHYKDLCGEDLSKFIDHIDPTLVKRAKFLDGTFHKFTGQ
jgi:hypothetical protein